MKNSNLYILILNLINIFPSQTSLDFTHSYVGQIVSLGNIQQQRPGDARMAPNQVGPIWHIKLRNEQQTNSVIRLK